MLSKHAPVRIAMHDRRRRVAELRQRGHTQQQIAAAVGVSRRTVASDLGAVASDFRTGAADHFAGYVSMQLDRIQTMRERLCAVMEAESSRPETVVRAVNELVHLEEREAQLLGLDAPARHHQATAAANAQPAMTDDEARAILAELASSGMSGLGTPELAAPATTAAIEPTPE